MNENGESNQIPADSLISFQMGRQFKVAPVVIKLRVAFYVG